MKHTKLKFSTNQLLDNLFENIMKVLPEIETDWEVIIKDGNPTFSTTIGNVSFVVEKFKIVFTLNSGENKESKVYEKIKRIGSHQKALPINLYDTLMKRFDCHDDYEFYHKIWRTLDIFNEKQHKRNEVSFTEEKQ